jgi:hypothetical protein
MTCDEVTRNLDDWWNGRLPEAKARAMEDHASQCVACYARLDAHSRPGDIPRRIAPPPSVRAATLSVVRRRRAVRRWRRGVAGATAIAAMALVAITLRPRTKSASDFPGAIKGITAMEHARPAFAALDAAESEIEDALRAAPDDSDLTDALDRIRHQRDELSRMVREAGS